ncbi:MAG: apolipoprotein N-acyltransferase [Deltaproteobacteria bacterium]|nr:apolipoprotein N-acyltransferase [Deltaproteobacteria bacterium]
MGYLGAVSALLTLSSALLYSASFPPLELHALAWLALAPLLVVAARERPRVAALHGFLWGWVVCLAIGWPLAGMLSRHLSIAPWLGWVGFAGGATFLVGAHVAVFAAWLSWISAGGRGGPLAIAAGWVVSEWIRLHGSAGIPWALSGYSQVPAAPLLQIADLAGPFGIGALVALVNAAVASTLAPRLRPPRPALAVACVAALFALAFSYGSWRLAERRDHGSVVDVAILQDGRAPSLVDVAAESDEALARYLALSEAASDGSPRIVFWPEYALSFVPDETPLESQQILDASDLIAADVVFGAPQVEPLDDAAADAPAHAPAHAPADRRSSETRHNSVFLVRDGELAGRYDKEEPLPLSERDSFGVRSHLGLPSYAPGTKTAPLASSAGRIGVLLCSEAMQPSLARERVRDGAVLLVNPSNDSWFGAEFAQRTQLRIASMRAVESRRFLIRPTTTGYSAVIDPTGRIIAKSGLDRAEILAARVLPRDEITPYHRFGDVLVGLALAWVAWTSYRAAAAGSAGSRSIFIGSRSST